MTRPLFAILLVCAALGANADLANPYPLTNTRYSTTPDLLAATVASDGHSFVVAMQTPHDVRTSHVVIGEAHRAFAEPVLTRYLDGAAPAIVWTGSGYLVAGTRGNAIVGRLLDRSGRPAEPEFTILGRGGAPRLASNGSRIAMVYAVDESPDKLQAAILDLSGRALVADILLDTGEGFRYDVATNGTSFRIAWSTTIAVKAATMTVAGQPATIETLESSAQAGRQVRVAAAGTDYVIAYRRGIHQIVAGNGGSTFTVAETGDGRIINDHALSWNGTDVVATYVTRGAYTNRLRRDGSPTTAPQEIEGYDDILSTAIASAGSTSLMLWIESDQTRSLLRSQFLGSGAPSGPKLTLSNAAADQNLTAAAGGSGGSFVAWVEENGSGRTVMAGIAGSDGSWTEIGAVSGPFVTPITTLLATAGEGYALVTTVGGSHTFFRFAPNGMPIGSPVPLPSTFTRIDGLAWNGTVFVVAGPTTNGLLGAARITPAGGLHPIVTLHFGGAVNAALTSDGENFLLTYDVPGACFPPCPGLPDPRALRFSAGLVQLGPEIRFGGDGVAPVAAWNGTDYLVVMRAGDSIVAKRLTREGEIRDVAPIVIHTANVARSRPRVTWFGSRYAVTWRTLNPGSGLAQTSALAYVDLAGNVSPAVAFDVDSLSHTDPVPVQMTIGQLAVVTTAVAYDAPYHGSERLFFRWAESYIAPAAPQLVKAESFDGRIALQWTRPDFAAGYRLEFKAGDQPWKEAERFFTAAETSVDVSGFRTGTPYRFRIRAWGRGGTSAYSNERSVYVSPRPRGR